jgi:hypothetical protein
VNTQRVVLTIGTHTWDYSTTEGTTEETKPVDQVEIVRSIPDNGWWPAQPDPAVATVHLTTAEALDLTDPSTVVNIDIYSPATAATPLEQFRGKIGPCAMIPAGESGSSYTIQATEVLADWGNHELVIAGKDGGNFCTWGVTFTASAEIHFACNALGIPTPPPFGNTGPPPVPAPTIYVGSEYNEPNGGGPVIEVPGSSNGVGVSSPSKSTTLGEFVDNLLFGWCMGYDPSYAGGVPTPLGPYTPARFVLAIDPATSAIVGKLMPKLPDPATTLVIPAGLVDADQIKWDTKSSSAVRSVYLGYFYADATSGLAPGPVTQRQWHASASSGASWGRDLARTDLYMAGDYAPDNYGRPSTDSIDVHSYDLAAHFYLQDPGPARPWTVESFAWRVYDAATPALAQLGQPVELNGCKPEWSPGAATSYVGLVQASKVTVTHKLQQTLTLRNANY